MRKRLTCPTCGRRFNSMNAATQHAASLSHGQPGSVELMEGDESLAEIAVEAEAKHAAGEPLNPLERALLGEEE